uniref:E3 ubiquitin-protein ligase TRIM21-like n=1 Tax=Semicossyphus pulcher TaxID=241346 RepID=UPI0037E8BBB4
MSLQVCSHCGWSKITSYQGLRIHQGKNGCTPKGMNIPQSDQFRLNSYIPKYTYVGPTINIAEPFVDIFTPSTQYEGEHNRQMKVWEERHQRNSGPMNTTPVKKENVFPSLPSPTIPAAREVDVLQMIKSILGNQQASLQTASNSDRTRRVLDFSGDAQPFLIGYQASPAAAEVNVEATNQSLFETPPRVLDNATKARRVLSFSSGAQQVEQPDWNISTTTAQETVVRQKEKEREEEREKEREKQKLLKARQGRIKADLQQKIQMREQKMEEVTSSAKACKGSLDSEWLEINNVFSDVIKVVEKVRKKALQPLEERRQRVKAEERNLVQKLQKEIDKLKNIIDELEQNQELQVSPPDKSQAWKNVTVDTSFSFGTLRTMTSNMMKKIDQKLETLSSVELKRTPKFAVNVKLDATTAHPCLDLSADGKKVKDGGNKQEVPHFSERFDLLGSVLGLNGLTSGKSYWEVEVRNKTGWDLGVTRSDANRKGKVSLTPDNGYWVTVHYDGKKYAAMTAPPVSLSLTDKPEKVGVFVDYQEGLVSFYDVTAQSHIYSFTGCSFNGEIVPYFSPHLLQNGNNSDPLIISAVTKQ